MHRFTSLLAALWCLAAAMSAQQLPPPPTPPSPPPSTGVPITPGDVRMQLQIQNSGGGPIIVDPLRPTLPSRTPGELSATATFNPPTVRVGRTSELNVVINGARRGIQVPDPLPVPPDLQLQSQGRSYGVQISGATQSDITTYRFTASALKPGTYTIGAFKVRVGEQTISVPAATLVVIEAAPGETPYQPLEAVIDIPPGDYYLGQHITGRLLLIDTPDETAQYVSHVMKTSGSFLFRTENRPRRDVFLWQGRQVGGMVVDVSMSPIKEGSTELSCEVLAMVQKVSGPGRIGGFTNQATLNTKPITMEVRPLPRVGKPESFTGAIGKFVLGAPKLSSAEVAVGDPVTLSVTITGEGNLDSIGTPPLPVGPEWQSYNPTADVKRDDESGMIWKTFTYTLVPRHEAIRSVPPIPFSYFDPEKKEYRDLTVPPTPVMVKPAPERSAALASIAEPGATPVVSNLPPPAANEPILSPLEESPGRARRSVVPIAGAPWFLAVQLIPASVLIGLWIWRRRQDYLAAHPEVLRRRRARSAVQRNLRTAREAAQAGDAQGFVRAGVTAFCEAAAPLDSAKPESLVLEEVMARLDPPDAEIARTVFMRAAGARYANGSANGFDPRALLPEVERVLGKLTRRIR